MYRKGQSDALPGQALPGAVRPSSVGLGYHDVSNCSDRRSSSSFPDDRFGCGLIGAYGVGFDAVSVGPRFTARSWGTIRSIYRQG